ncbi:universal stress protein UspA [Acidovorax sp. SRB_14]|uniref:universal stress protein n=1 Tax=Acidovorax sp. SRB_14 TaxID=1962699 RepID=UPI00146E4F21|nr:universal stress protein [Acidovorax sp. SRB_14]NMM80819.1 universal stress protein UspA [Acidovorax sp. SRB_14]NMM85791.1 universal stress protein UspA [Rhodococcus sp. SRB_17]
MNHQICACIDALPAAAAVVDWAAWAALRLNAPLQLLHVLDEPAAMPPVGDYSGALGFGAQELLQQQLSALDEQRGAIEREAGRHLLQSACERASAAGVPHVAEGMHYGDLVETLLGLEASTRLVVLGEHYRASTPRRIYLSHHVERVVRSIKRPVLVATVSPFAAPERFVLAFDGSATARKMITMVAASPLLQGLPALVAMVAPDTPEAHRQLHEAQSVLQAAGFAVQTALRQGDPEQALPELLATQGNAVLVMGAYGHARIRQLIVGSTTTALLRLSPVPVLVLR